MGLKYLPKTGETVDVHSYMQKSWDFQFFQRCSILIELVKEDEIVCKLETMGKWMERKAVFAFLPFEKKGWLLIWSTVLRERIL